MSHKGISCREELEVSFGGKIFLTPHVVWPESWFAFGLFQQLSWGRSLKKIFAQFKKTSFELRWARHFLALRRTRIRIFVFNSHFSPFKFALNCGTEFRNAKITAALLCENSKFSCGVGALLSLNRNRPRSAATFIFANLLMLFAAFRFHNFEFSTLNCVLWRGSKQKLQSQFWGCKDAN